MNLPEQLGLVAGDSDYMRLKRALQAAYAWELAECGAVRIDQDKVYLAGMAPPELNDVLGWLRSRTEPCTVPQLIYHVDAPVGLVTEHVSRRLVQLGMCEEKTVTRLFVFKQVTWPRTAAGQAEADRLKSQFAAAVQTLRQFETAGERRALVGAMLLDLCRLPNQVLEPRSFVCAVQAGLVSQPMMAEFARLIEGEDLGANLFNALLELGS